MNPDQIQQGDVTLERVAKLPDGVGLKEIPLEERCDITGEYRHYGLDEEKEKEGKYFMDPIPRPGRSQHWRQSQ